MATKELQTRIALKYDSYSAWTSSPGKDLILLKGEIGICEIPSTNATATTAPTTLFKVGDGVNTFENLRWSSALAADVYDWAKSETVVLDGTTIKFKTGDSVKHSIDLSSFATGAEVEDISSRIAELEAKFTGDNSVQNQLTALGGRIDGILNDADIKSFTDAKAYADGKEVQTKKYTDDSVAGAKSEAATNLSNAVTELEAADSALSGRIAALEGEGGVVANALKEAKEYAESEADAAEEAAKSYADQKDTALKTELQGYADQAEADAKKDAADNLAAAVATQATIDAAQDDEIAKKLDKTTFNSFNNGTSKSVSEIEADIVSKAGTAKSEAIAAAKTETEQQVKTLADGAVAENTAAITAMDEAYKKADSALGERVTTIEGKLADVTNVMDFVGAVEALPASTEGYQNGDVLVVTGGDNAGKEYVVSGGDFVEFGYADGNTAAISGLQSRMDTAKEDIDDLQTEIITKLAAETFNTWKATHEADHANKQTDISQEIDDDVAAEAALREAADKAINDKIGTLPTGEDAYTTLVEGIANAQKAGDDAASVAAGAVGRLDTLEPKVETLQDLTDGYSGKGSIKTAVDKAQEDATTANTAVGTLEGVVGTLRTEYDVTKALATTNEAAIAALTTKVDTAEQDIVDIKAIVSAEGGNSNAQLRSDITALQELTAEDGEIRQEIAAAKKAGDDAAQAVTALANGQVNTNKTDLANLTTRVAAVEADYLKAADVYIFNCGSSTTVLHTA